jgi:hypothetical protein
MDSSDLLSSRRDRIKANNYNNQKETEYPNKMPRLSSQDLIDIKRGVQEVSLENGTIVLPACGGPTCSQDVTAAGGLYPPSKQGWFVETVASIPDFYPTSIDFDSAGNVYYAGYKFQNGPGILGIFIYRINTDGSVIQIYQYVYNIIMDAMPSIAIDRTNTGIDYIYTFDAIGLAGIKLTKLSIDLSNPSNIAVVDTVYNSSVPYSLGGTGSIIIKPGTTGLNTIVYFGLNFDYIKTSVLSTSTVTYTLMVGSGSPGYQNGTATNAQFIPINLTILPSIYSYILPKNGSIGNDDLFVTDAGNNVIRSIENEPVVTVVTTYAGPLPPPPPPPPPPPTSGSNDGAITTARFYGPSGITYGPGGNILISDSGNNLFRLIDVASSSVSTIGGYPIILAALNANQKVDGPLSNPLTTFSRVTAIASLPSNPNIIYIADKFIQNSNPLDPLPNMRRLIYYP